MTIRTSPSVARIAGVLLCALAAGAAPAARDYEFRHENVLGTSLELCVRADTEEAARSAEARALGEIDRLAAVFSGYDASSEFRRWQATIDRPTKVSPELFELLRASDRWRERSGGAFDPRVQALTRTLVALRPARPAADRRRAGEGQGAHGPARLAARRRRGHGRAPDGLPAEPQLDRQGLHHRPRLRRRARSRAGRPGRAPEHRRRRPRRRRRRPDGRGRPAGRRLGDGRADRPRRGPRPVGRHERQFPARVPHPRRVVLAHLRPPDGPARRAGGGRDRHRGAGRGRERAGHHAQRAPRRGRPAPGRVPPGRRVPARHGRRAGPQERRVGPLRATAGRAAAPATPVALAQDAEGRPGRLVGRHVTSCS